MKTFGYVYRNNNGVLKNGNLQATDRADALRQIKTMGHMPVSVTESKAIVSNVAWKPARHLISRMIIAGIAIVAGLAIWRFADQGPALENPVPDKMQTASGKSSSPVIQSQSVDEETSSVATSPVEPIPHKMGSPSHQQAAPPPPQSAPLSQRPQTDMPEAVAEEEQKPQRPNQFKNSTEQLLAMAMSAPPGAMIPPLPIPGNLDEDFINSLTNTIMIYDDDDERTAQLKESVAVAKNQMLELLKEGRSVADVLKEYQETANERAAIRSEAQRELNALYRSGQTQEAQEYMEKINASFRGMDIEPVSLPKPRKTR